MRNPKPESRNQKPETRIQKPETNDERQEAKKKRPKATSQEQTALAWPPPTSLYVHIPFCPYKCPYCDFVTYVGGGGLFQPYVRALCQEIGQIGRRSPARRISTLYFGGGTPSMLPSGHIAEVIAAARGSFGLRADAEISLEANPDAIDAAKLAGLREVGVNRISFGVQSLDARELALLGRGHSPDQVARSLAWARDAGFRNASVDLIYGTPSQTAKSWRSTVDAVLALQPEHISLYSLIVEPGTRFSRWHRSGLLALPEDDLVADMYIVACEMLAGSGYVHYEVANWCRPGFEARHNLVYWHDDEFLAAGVGAWDYVRPFRSARVRHTKRYIDCMERGQDPIAKREPVSREDERFETTVMRLRLLQEGLSRSRYRDRFGESLDDRYGSVIKELQAQGFVSDDGDRVRLREAMVPLANEAWERFLPAPATPPSP